MSRPGNKQSLKAVIGLMMMLCTSVQAQPWLYNGSDIYYNGGKVGIGTASPGNNKLKIAGISPTVNGIEIVSSPANYTAHVQLIAGQAPHDRGFRFINHAYGGNRFFYLTHNLDYDGTDWTQGNWAGSNIIRFINGEMNFYADPQDVGGSQTVITPTMRMTILSSGNVGIGTTSPKNKLDVEGSAVIGASYSGTNTAPSNGLLVQGNVGIGATNPTAKLHVVGDNGGAKTPAPTGAHLVGGVGGAGSAGGKIIITGGQGGPIGGGPSGTGGDIEISGGAGGEGFGSGGAVYIKGGTPSGASDYGNILLASSGGNVGIGTTNPGSYKLAVNGKIRAKDVVVETGWSDFVFEDDYELKPLNEVEIFIQTHKHLPDIPSAEEVSENGVALGDMQALLLQKIEELTLYMIEMDKENQALKARVAELEK